MGTNAKILNGRYQLRRLLGEGGTAVVYEAFDQPLNRVVAIKQLKAQMFDAAGQREAEVLASLQHPSLPRVLDYFVAGVGHIVMEFVPGENLAQRLAREGRQPVGLVTRWAGELLGVLAYLHDRGLVHCDLKPANIKLGTDGRVLLLDFGLVHEASRPALVSGYSRPYSSPEQALGEAVGPASDLYALGATLYHLASGIAPPDSVARREALAAGRPDPLVLAGASEPLAGLLRQLLALDAGGRPGAAAANGWLRTQPGSAQAEGFGDSVTLVRPVVSAAVAGAAPARVAAPRLKRRRVPAAASRSRLVRELITLVLVLGVSGLGAGIYQLAKQLGNLLPATAQQHGASSNRTSGATGAVPVSRLLRRPSDDLSEFDKAAYYVALGGDYKMPQEDPSVVVVVKPGTQATALVSATGQPSDGERLQSERPLVPDYDRHIYNAAEVDQTAHFNPISPVRVSRTDPGRDLHGEVVLGAVVDWLGSVSVVNVIRPLPYGLTYSAREALYGVSFTPAHKHGRAVSQFVEFHFTF